MVILVGMPGSGKSSAGRHIARRLGLDFADVDQLLVEQFGMPINDYFAQHGEQAFRDEEAAMLQRLVQQQPHCVLSTGGGAVLRPENRQLLKASGTVVYLRVQPEELYRRVRYDRKRPLLQVSNPRKRLQELFAQRDPLYREVAHFVIDSSRGSVNALVNTVVMQLELAGFSALPPQPQAGL